MHRSFAPCPLHPPQARRRAAAAWPLLCAVLVAGAAAAAPAPQDFAWQWPLDTGGNDGLVALTLDAAVYGQLTRQDLGDLVAFNGNGEPIPLGAAAPPQQRARSLQPAPVAVPLFRTVAGASGGSDAIALHIARGSDGRLTRLDAGVGPAQPRGAQDLLLDLSALQRPVHALVLELSASATPLNARVRVDGSDDLGRWQLLAQDLALVSLQHQGVRLERRRLELPVTALPYLRIRRTDTAATLPVDAVAAVPAPVEAGLVVPPLQHLLVAGRAVQAPVDSTAGAFAFDSGGPFPVARVDVQLAERNAIATVRVQSRGDADAPWRERARFTAFRLGEGDDAVGNAAVEVGGVRDRHWRVLTTPAVATPPRLRLSWAPDRFLLLTRGPPPYLLAAGSARAARAEYPLTVALAELQARHGEHWQPPRAVLGQGARLAGATALQPARAPVPLRQWLLWTVLVGGALVLIAMVLRLLRQPGSS